MARKNPIPKRKASGKKSSKKGSAIKRFLSILKWIIIGFFGSTLFFVVIYRFINPPVTTFMAYRTVSQVFKGEKLQLKKNWIDIEDISPNMIRAVIAAEDNLFVKHNGFDKAAIERAIEHNKKGKRIRGGSTISQQTAKNVFLWPNRSFVRKGLEVYFTFLIENIWNKQRIMEVYLNVIETGKGIYGVEKASKTYFQKSSTSLSPGEAALIAASLPSPLRYSITNPGPYMRSRQAQIVTQMYNIETLKVKK